MLLGWQDVVESIFDIAGRDGDALVLFNFLDELTYRTGPTWAAGRSGR